MHTENQTTSSITMDRSPNAVALDNLVRRKLRVSDPNDAGQIAEALRKIYVDESHALDQEAAGLPFLPVRQATQSIDSPTSSRAELTQAIDDVNRDLNSLLTNAMLKDIEAELKGWASAIRSAIAEGTNAARFALDPRQRDLAFSVRRLLGGYARIARLVGALTPNLSPQYRRLAQSLDEVGSVILVLMGDALANVGFSGGRFLLQAPASDLQARRDAAINSLRNLIGSVQQGSDNNQWPRGLIAYQQLLNNIEKNGHSDLRALLVENNLAKLMDDLIHWTTSGSAEDLRALGATAHLSVQRIRRLVIFAKQNGIDKEAPPLTAFLASLMLFVDAFANAANGHRVLFISRPPIVFYGLYGIGGPDDATQRLIDLIIERGKLAQELDCFLGCDCGQDKVRCQVLLDKVLYDVDRAIDLYAMGSDPIGNGEAEQRAFGYGLLIDQVQKFDLRSEPATGCIDSESKLADMLNKIINILWSPTLAVAENRDSVLNLDNKIGDLENIVKERISQELCIQRDADGQWKALIQTMAPSCHPSSRSIQDLEEVINAAIMRVGNVENCQSFEIDAPADLATIGERLLEGRGLNGDRFVADI